jgi:hypothetical protein
MMGPSEVGTLPDCTGTSMRFLFRSLVIIAVIALNSPVWQSGTGEPAPIDSAQAIAILAKIDPKAAMQGAVSLREAAEVLAGLEPETRARMLELAATAIAGKEAAQPPRH